LLSANLSYETDSLYNICVPIGKQGSLQLHITGIYTKKHAAQRAAKIREE